MVEKSFDVVVVHYSEIAVKGGNRDFFERRLMNNIQNSLKGQFSSVVKRYGRINCFLKEGYDRGLIVSTLKKVSGIANFSLALSAKLNYDDIKSKVSMIISGRNFSNFSISARRSFKDFPKSSKQLNIDLGGVVLDAFPEVKVNLTDPEFTIFVEVGEKEALVYSSVEKFVGVGGLPVGSSGKVISSLSGGIDSPVSSFMLMKRGCEVILCHIHNENVDSIRVKEKILALSKILSSFQVSTKLFIIPFGEIQRVIISVVPSKLRMILYRRFMMRILNSLNSHYKLNAKALVTGDSVGQVASQTLDNISNIRDASVLPVFSPLIGMNKEEIITLSKMIGSYDTSIIPSDDCCSFMIAKSPDTMSKLREVLSLEKDIPDFDKLINEAVKNAELIKF